VYNIESVFKEPLLRSVLKCVAVCCSVLQCVAVCCSALQVSALQGPSNAVC